MKPSRFLNLLVAFLFTAVAYANPPTVSANQSSLQTTGEITGIGQICNSRGQCGDFSITFNPAGGPVTGSVYVNWPITNLDTGEKVCEEILQGTLTGTFDGEDGGAVRGTIATGQVTITWSVQCDTCINSNTSAVGTTWEGNLRADGTGNGRIGPVDILWNVTYSAEDFQAGLGGSPRPTKTPGTAPTTATETPGAPQPILPGTTITATGQFCDNTLGFCGEISITFNPAGGPVTGTMHSTHTVPAGDHQETLNVNGTLDGAFTGGDGGQVIGTITSGEWEWTCPTCDFVLATPASLSDYPWGGNLNADGTGNGTLYTGSTWSVTFSAADFQAGLAGPTQAADTPTPIGLDYIQQQIGGISIEMGDKAFSEHQLQLINKVWNNLPPIMRDQVALQHIVRYTSAWDINTGNNKPNVMGDYSAWDQRDCPDCARTANTIRIFDTATQSSYFSDATGDTDFEATILHEITHAFQSYKSDQDIYTYPSDNPLVQDFITDSKTPGIRDGWGWDATKRKWTFYQPPGSTSKPPTNYGYTNPMEDLCESVKMYVYNPQLLQNSSPQRYTYIRYKIYGGIEYDNGKPKGK